MLWLLSSLNNCGSGLVARSGVQVDDWAAQAVAWVWAPNHGIFKVLFVLHKNLVMCCRTGFLGTHTSKQWTTFIHSPTCFFHLKNTYWACVLGQKVGRYWGERPRSWPKMFIALGEDGHVNSACWGKGLRDAPWEQRKCLDFRARTPLGVSGWVGGRSEGTGIAERVTATAKVWRWKQYHVFRKCQWPLLMECTGVKWMGIKAWRCKRPVQGIWPWEGVVLS